MIKTTNFKDTKIGYKVKGEGITIVLVHGYLESKDIWGDFFEELSDMYKIIAIDLPGHGESECFGEIHTIDFMADCVNSVLECESISKCVLFGHSMGGYVVLSFSKKFSEKLLGFSLFHSHPFADTDAIKTRRMDEIDLLQMGKKDLIIKANIPKAFANGNLDKFRSNFELVKEIARNTNERGMINALKGMMDRSDSIEFLKSSLLPFLMILGEKDNYIAYDDMSQKVQIPINGELISLKQSGHMGFIEEKQKALEVITEFIKGIK